MGAKVPEDRESEFAVRMPGDKFSSFADSGQCQEEMPVQRDSQEDVH